MGRANHSGLVERNVAFRDREIRARGMVRKKNGYKFRLRPMNIQDWEYAKIIAKIIAKFKSILIYKIKGK